MSYPRHARPRTTSAATGKRSCHKLRVRARNHGGSVLKHTRAPVFDPAPPGAASGSLLRRLDEPFLEVAELSAEDDVRTVLGVARLGESDLAGWWNTRLYSRAGRYILSRSFPRTWKPAAGQLLVLSCARWHNHAFSGRPTAIHLFSPQLPALGWTQSWLAEQKTSSPTDPIFDELLGWSNTTDAAAAVSGRLQAVDMTAEVVAGNVRLGAMEADRLNDPVEVSLMVSMLASTYVTTVGALQVPYFDAV